MTDPASLTSAAPPAVPGAALAAPYELVNSASRAPLLLLCDHASNVIPSEFAGLGLDEGHLARHIAWDIGIATVTRELSRQLNAPALLNGYSRLLVDPNRALDDPTLMPQISDDVVIPGNRGLSGQEVEARIARFHRPYHEAIEAKLTAMIANGPEPAIVSLHSFTPVIKGRERPWQVGILWNRDERLPLPLMARLRADGLVVGDNEPYSGRDGHGYTLHRHADERGLPNALIEVRQDLIDTHQGAVDWARRFGQVLRDTLATVGIHRLGGQQ